MERVQKVIDDDTFKAVLGGGRGLSCTQARARACAQQVAEAEFERAQRALLAAAVLVYCEDCGTLCAHGSVEVENPDWDERLRSADGHDILEFVDVAAGCCPNPECESFNQ